MGKEEIESVVEVFVANVVEKVQSDALDVVAAIMEGVDAAKFFSLFNKMTVPELLAVGETLDRKWAIENRSNNAAMIRQKAALAKVLTVLINAGAASLMAEMN